MWPNFRYDDDIAKVSDWGLNDFGRRFSNTGHIIIDTLIHARGSITHARLPWYTSGFT